MVSVRSVVLNPWTLGVAAGATTVFGSTSSVLAHPTIKANSSGGQALVQKGELSTRDFSTFLEKQKFTPGACCTKPDGTTGVRQTDGSCGGSCGVRGATPEEVLLAVGSVTPSKSVLVSENTAGQNWLDICYDPEKHVQALRNLGLQYDPNTEILQASHQETNCTISAVPKPAI